MNDLTPETTPAPAPPGWWHRVFVGPKGLRAGWRLLIFFALLLTMSAAVSRLTRSMAAGLAQSFTASLVLLTRAFGFALLLLAAFIMSRFEGRKLGDYGLPARKSFGRDFWMGGLWGFVMLSVIVGLMAAARAYSPGGLAIAAAGILKFGFLWAVAFLFVGLFEEFLVRGYLQFTLTTGVGFWPAAVLTSTLFALAHRGNPGETWVGLANIVLIAAFLCLALRRTGSLWFAVGWHMAFDWGESFFYSTPNSGLHAVGHLFDATLMGSKWLSGGSVGPEGSIFDLLVMAAGILLLARLYPDAKYPAGDVAVAGPSLPEGPAVAAASS